VSPAEVLAGELAERHAAGLVSLGAILGAELGRCFNDPLAFCCTFFRWGDQNAGLGGVEGPDLWQRAVLADVGRMLRQGVPLRVAIAAGHGIGKGALCSMLLLWLMATRPGLAGVVTANTGAQLRSKTWRELSIWHKRLIPALAEWFEWTAHRFFCKHSPETWGIDAVCWNERKPEAFAGLHSRDVVVVFDEASAIPDSIWEVTEGAMTTIGAQWFVFGNPTRNTGRFHRCFHRDRHRWRRWSIDSRLARFTDKAQLRRWVEDHGEDSDFVRVRVRGLFPRAASIQLIGFDLVEASILRPVVDDPGAALLMGVDVARFGDDQSVIAWRCGRDARSIPWAKYRGLDGIALAGHVGAAVDKWKPDAVFIDGGGVGASVIDQLKARRYRFHAVNSGSSARDGKEYCNKRAEMWGELKAWLGEGCIPDDPELTDDLCGPFYSWDRHQRLILEEKPDMKKRGLASPDCGDALALTFAERVPRRDSPNRRRGGGAVEVEVGFN
jgi:hypothetical protein